MAEIERKLGCIPMAEQAKLAKSQGLKSDAEKYEELVAPWDATNKPRITSWDTIKSTLQAEAERDDLIKEKASFVPFWEFAKSQGIDCDTLFGTYQRQNDCAAWATTRCYLVRLLDQIQRGSEQSVENINQMALYAFSGDAFKSGQRIQNGGRTLGSVAMASCEYGLLPSRLAGEYDGTCRVTDAIANNQDEGLNRQAGWVELSFDTDDEIIEAVRLCLRGHHPILMGNTTALQDGTSQDSNGVYVSTVRGGWGGGHATAILYCKCVNNSWYYWIGNSHGNIYESGDGSPAWGTFVTEDGLRRYIDGQFRDMYALTWCESPHGADNLNLNPVTK